MPAVSFGISLVWWIAIKQMKRRRLGGALFSPSEIINSSLGLNLIICCVLQIAESLPIPMGCTKSLHGKAAICLFRTLDLSILLKTLLLSKTSFPFSGLTFLSFHLKKTPVELGNSPLYDIRNIKLREKLRNWDSDAVFITDAVGKSCSPLSFCPTLSLKKCISICKLAVQACLCNGHIFLGCKCHASTSFWLLGWLWLSSSQF